MHIDVSCNLGDRPALIKDERHRAGLVLISETTPRRTHFTASQFGAANLGVHQTGYVPVDPAALGLPVTAFARIRPVTGKLSTIAELAQTLPQVTECHRITGEDCFLVKVHAPTVEQLEDILDRFLLYGQTVTSVVVSTPVPPRPLPLNALDSASARRTGPRRNRLTQSTRS